MLTACGIETFKGRNKVVVPLARCNSAYRLRYWNHRNLPSLNLKVANWLQQCLPLAVLKQFRQNIFVLKILPCCNSAYRLRYWNVSYCMNGANVTTALQQCLPLAVLKQDIFRNRVIILKLQQCLPLAVLKRLINVLSYVHVSCCNSAYRLRYWNNPIGLNISPFSRRCNSAYRLRYWNSNSAIFCLTAYSASCNSAYHLRYWNLSVTCSPTLNTVAVATVLTACGIETH